MRRKIFFSGTILTLMLLMSSSTAFAQSLQMTEAEAQTIRTEIRSGTPIKEVLERHNITFGQVKRALGEAGLKQGKRKITRQQITSLATKLGLDINQVGQEIEQGKTFQQILKDHSISQEQLRDAFKEEMKNRFDRGTIK